MNAPKTRTKWTAGDNAQFLALQQEGKTCREIADIMGRTLEAMRFRSKKLRATPGRKFVKNTLEYVLKRLATEVIEDKESGCFIWQGGKIAQGYGAIRLDDKDQMAHRIAYENAKGPIPEGLYIDHLCRRRDCINPDHLEPVTHAENLRRAIKDTCIRGHAKTDDNIYVSPKGLRQCRECKKIRKAEFQERRHAKAS